MATALVVERTAARCRATMEALVELPGVGRKTANVVLGHALGVPGLPVDRHVLRVANRIGIARSDDPEVVETAALRRDAAGRLDAHVRHADPARPPHLQAAPALRPVRGARRLRVLPTRRLEGRRRVPEAKPDRRQPQGQRRAQAADAQDAERRSREVQVAAEPTTSKNDSTGFDASSRKRCARFRGASATR